MKYKKWLKRSLEDAIESKSLMLEIEWKCGDYIGEFNKSDKYFKNNIINSIDNIMERSRLVQSHLKELIVLLSEARIIRDRK